MEAVEISAIPRHMLHPSFSSLTPLFLKQWFWSGFLYFSSFRDSFQKISNQQWLLKTKSNDVETSDKNSNLFMVDIT